MTLYMFACELYLSFVRPNGVGITSTKRTPANPTVVWDLEQSTAYAAHFYIIQPKTLEAQMLDAHFQCGFNFTASSFHIFVVS